MEIIIATSNQGKLKEFNDFFKELNVTFKSLKDVGFTDEIIEDGNSFKENAHIKARAVYDKYHIPTLADDSGLSVYALNLAPGIYSARYKGLKTEKERRLAVLNEVLDKEDKRAYFTCHITLIMDDKIYDFEGIKEGFIGPEKGSDGFGYDPIFYINANETFATIGEKRKNEISHRGIAFRKLKEFLNDFSR